MVDGLRLAIEEKPTLILLDLMLPKLSGEEVCKAIRSDQHEEISKIPIIMITAKNTIADKVKGRDMGANSYLSKPFDWNDLYSEIMLCLQPPA